MPNANLTIIQTPLLSGIWSGKDPEKRHAKSLYFKDIEPCA